MKFILLLLPLFWVGYAISQDAPLMNDPTQELPEASESTVSAPPSAPEIPNDIPNDVPPVSPDDAANLANVFNPSNEAFIYDPTGKRDPFDPNLGTTAPEQVLSIDEPDEPVAVKSSRSLEPLEGFDLAQIRVEAVIWDTKNPRAMVRDPQGGIHYIKVKSRIGKKDGFVVAIREGEVVVVEYAPDSNGQYIKSFKALELR